MLDDLLRILGLVLGLLATLFGLIKVWQEARSASGKAATEGLQAVADEWRELKEAYAQRSIAAEQRASAVEKLAEDLKRDHEQAAKALAEQHSERFAAIEGETRQLRADVDKLRKTEGRLVGWVGRLHTGITDGTIPPLPQMPRWLAALLIHEATRPGDDDDDDE